MGEDPGDEELRETVAEVADAWQVFPEPGVLTTGGLERANQEPRGMWRPGKGRRRSPNDRKRRP